MEQRLQLAEAIRLSGHNLVGGSSGRPLFLMVDTAWTLPTRATRSTIATYLSARKNQGFNTVMVTFDHWKKVYGDEPFARRGDGKWDVTRPLVTPGTNPSSPAVYDYWGHALYAVNQAIARGFYVVLSTGASPGISGGWSGEPADTYIDSPQAAYSYGRFLGARVQAHISKVASWVDSFLPLSPSPRFNGGCPCENAKRDQTDVIYKVRKVDGARVQCSIKMCFQIKILEHSCAFAAQYLCRKAYQPPQCNEKNQRHKKCRDLICKHGRYCRPQRQENACQQDHSEIGCQDHIPVNARRHKLARNNWIDQCHRQ